MSTSPARRRWRTVLVVGLIAVVAMALGVTADVLLRQTGDVSNPSVEFTPEPEPAPPPPTSPANQRRKADNFIWPIYGFERTRVRTFDAPPRLRPPYRRKWMVGSSVLLEFSPVMRGKWLYLLRNDGLLEQINKHNGKTGWQRKPGVLAASSPAVDERRVYAVTLEREKGSGQGEVVAVNQKTGKYVWRRPLPSRSESSPVLANDRLYFGSENGTVYALRTSDGSPVWTYKANDAVKGGPALWKGKLYFGDYSGTVHAISAATGERVWTASTSGTNLGFGSGNFYSTPAVAFGRVYLGNTDGKVYSFSARTGELAWSKSTGGYVYSSPAVANVDGLGPTVYIGSYDGNLYALDARSGDVRWQHDAGGKISGSANIIGDWVYFSNLDARTTIALGARTGANAQVIGKGSFNPVISDGERLILTGYTNLYGLEPKGASPAAKRRAARRAARRARQRERRQARREARRKRREARAERRRERREAQAERRRERRSDR